MDEDAELAVVEPLEEIHASRETSCRSSNPQAQCRRFGNTDVKLLREGSPSTSTITVEFLAEPRTPTCTFFWSPGQSRFILPGFHGLEPLACQGYPKTTSGNALGSGLFTKTSTTWIFVSNPLLRRSH